MTSGIPIFWAESCVSYDLQRDASSQVPLETATQVAARAFSHWQDVICPDVDAAPSVRFVDAGPVSCSRVEFNDPRGPTPVLGGNANIIVFRDTGWNHTNTYDPTSTVALTTVTYSAITGQIYDADIEVNGQLPLSTSDAPASEAFDLESVLTHEVGHLLGLAHSDADCASECPVMHASYSHGSLAFRTLKDDDITAVCTVYAPDRSATSSACVPMGGLASECASPQQPEQANSGIDCEIAPFGRNVRSNAQAVVLAGIITVLIAGRRRRSHNPR